MDTLTLVTPFGTIPVTHKTLPYVLAIAMLIGVAIGAVAGLAGVLLAIS